MEIVRREIDAPRQREDAMGGDADLEDCALAQPFCKASEEPRGNMLNDENWDRKISGKRFEQGL